MRKFFFAVACVAFMLCSCCRQANEFNFQKWERKKPFEYKLKKVSKNGTKFKNGSGIADVNTETLKSNYMKAKDYNQMYDNMCEVEKLAGTCRENIFLNGDKNRNDILKAISRQQVLLVQVELLLSEGSVKGGKSLQDE